MKQNTKALEEAYKKIIANAELQRKFMKATQEGKLEKFLEEQKIEATVEDVKAYLTEKYASKDVELSKDELDLAAGGKTEEDERLVKWNIMSVISIGFGCIASDAMAEDCEMKV